MEHSPLDGLDEIDWKSLEHAYGSAHNVPTILRGLLAEEEQVHSLGALYGALYHQGSLYSSTPYAVPFLVRIATSPTTPGRDEVLVYLATLTHRERWFAIPRPEPLGPREAAAPESLARADEQGRLWDATCAAIAREAEALVALLEDRSPRVRAAAAFVLGCLPEARTSLQPSLRVAIARERKDRVRATMILALFRLSPSEADREHALELMAAPRAIHGAQSAWLAPAPAAQSLACAMGLAWSLGHRAPKVVMKRLLEGLQAGPPEDDEEAADTSDIHGQNLLAAIFGGPSAPRPPQKPRLLARAWSGMPWHERRHRLCAATEVVAALCAMTPRDDVRVLDAVMARVRADRAALAPLLDSSLFEDEPLFQALLFLAFRDQHSIGVGATNEERVSRSIADPGPRQRPPADVRALTTKQREVLEILAIQPWPSSDIGDRLGALGLPDTRDALKRLLELPTGADGG